MALNPQITPPDNKGDQYLKWTPDLTGDVYEVVTSTGKSRTFDPSLSTTRLGTNIPQPVVVSIAVLDISSQPAERAIFPSTTPLPDGLTMYDRLSYGADMYGH